MDFFERVGGTISAKSKVAAQKAKDVADLAKLNSQVGQLEGKIKTYYQIIGEKVYLNEKDQDHSGLEAEFDLITDAYVEIGRIKKQIADLKGTRECPGCHAEVDNSFAFCPKCGAKMEAEESAEESAACECGEDAAEESCACDEAAESCAAESDAEPCSCAEEADACCCEEKAE